MRRSLPSFGLLVLSLIVLTATACNRMDVAFSTTGPAPLVASVNLSDSFGVEPSTVRPEVLSGSCGAHSPFGVRLGIRIRGGHDVILRGVRFSFEDPFGKRALPEVMPIPSLLAPLPTGPTVPTSAVTQPGVAPLPPSSPIPIPGASSTVTGVLVRAGSHSRFDYFLRFSCVVISEGMIIVVIDAADHRGRPHTSELRVAVN